MCSSIDGSSSAIGGTGRPEPVVASVRSLGTTPEKEEGNPDMNQKKWKWLLAMLAVLALVAAACGDDSDTSDDDGGADTSTSDDDTTTGGDDGAAVVEALDANGDGEVRIGIAAQGPRDDGGYYEALIRQAEEFSAAPGFGDVIVVDNITFEDAATELDNLANQPVDIILIGASGVAGPMPELSAQYPDIYWYCNCGAGFAPGDTYSQTGDDGSAIHYTAGVAFGTVLAATGGDSVAIIGCCDLPFETEMVLAIEMGMQSVDPSFSVTYTPSGEFDFDFDNVANATVAFDAAVAAGADLIYPFLGGALVPVAKLANGAGLPVANPGSSNACEETEATYDVAVTFDAGDYVANVFPEIIAGTFPEGSIRTFIPGDEFNLNGAVFCGGDYDTTALDEAYVAVSSGSLDGDFGAIKGQAYGG